MLGDDYILVLFLNLSKCIKQIANINFLKYSAFSIDNLCNCLEWAFRKFYSEGCGLSSEQFQDICIIFAFVAHSLT
jgi:hypothetical protein